MEKREEEKEEESNTEDHKREEDETLGEKEEKESERKVDFNDEEYDDTEDDKEEEDNEEKEEGNDKVDFNDEEDDDNEDDKEGEDDEKEEEGNDDQDGGDKGEKAQGSNKMLKVSPMDKKCIPGILYLGHIPPRFRPKHLRNLLSVYGEIGRIFLQPEDHRVRRSKKKSGLRRCDFTEGWVEFRDKRVAKRVAASLHNTPMGTRKRQRFSSDLWCLKYLHRFQWTHLSERLAYEQTVLHQRLRTEVAQAKKETNFYLNNVEKSARMEKLRKKRQRGGEELTDKTWDFTQRQTEEEIQMKKRKKDSAYQRNLNKARLIQEKSKSNVSLLAKIFNSKPSD